MDSTTQAMQRIRDATDISGGAKFPTFMLSNMRRWERQGLIELHLTASGEPCARITDKGRTKANSGT